MRLSLIASFLSVVFFSYGQSKIDVLHYKYEIDLSDNHDSIYGKAGILVKFLEPASGIELNLYHEKEGKGMRVSEINGAGIKSREQHQNKIKIGFNEVAGKGDTLLFTIFYNGIPANGLIISKNQYGKRTFFGDNWPNRAHHWLPCVDDPADKASVEFIITAPSHYQVVANGIQVEETNLPDNKKLTHWKEDVPLPTKVMVIGVADFAVQHVGSVNECIPVSSWVFPENKAEGFYDYAMAKDVLAWHINYIGPYAYKKLANVQSKTMFGGMENAGAIFYYEGSVTGKRMEEELQSHEIVHQWFGNHATEKSFAHLWLSEGFATYLTHVYMEAKYGSDSLNKRMKADREIVIDFVKTSKRPVVDTVSDYMRLLNANSYQKGSWVLHMLRRQLGDAVFHKSIRDYYAAYAGKNADTKDLQKIFEANSGKKLDIFFRQWLHTPENPVVNIKWKNMKKEGKVAITVEQTQNRVFEFPLDIYLISGLRKNKAEKLLITKKTETFYFPVKSEILQVDTDYNTSLLAEIVTTQIQ
ncbi:MAG: M1 family aminopeptidase [Bacteroidota bacterium]